MEGELTQLTPTWGTLPGAFSCPPTCTHPVGAFGADSVFAPAPASCADESDPPTPIKRAAVSASARMGPEAVFFAGSSICDSPDPCDFVPCAQVVVSPPARFSVGRGCVSLARGFGRRSGSLGSRSSERLSDRLSEPSLAGGSLRERSRSTDGDEVDAVEDRESSAGRLAGRQPRQRSARPTTRAAVSSAQTPRGDTPGYHIEPPSAVFRGRSACARRRSCRGEGPSKNTSTGEDGDRILRKRLLNVLKAQGKGQLRVLVREFVARGLLPPGADASDASEGEFSGDVGRYSEDFRRSRQSDLSTSEASDHGCLEGGPVGMGDRASWGGISVDRLEQEFDANWDERLLALDAGPADSDASACRASTEPESGHAAAQETNWPLDECSAAGGSQNPLGSEESPSAGVEQSVGAVTGATLGALETDFESSPAPERSSKKKANAACTAGSARKRRTFGARGADKKRSSKEIQSPRDRRSVGNAEAGWDRSLNAGLTTAGRVAVGVLVLFGCALLLVRRGAVDAKCRGLRRFLPTCGRVGAHAFDEKHAKCDACQSRLEGSEGEEGEASPGQNGANVPKRKNEAPDDCVVLKCVIAGCSAGVICAASQWGSLMVL